MQAFDRILIVDWSAANGLTSATKLADSIWIGRCDAAGSSEHHHRTRQLAEAHLLREIAAAKGEGKRLLLGFDFAFGYPKGFAQALTGQASAPSVWAWLAAHITDSADNRNNRFEVAAQINRRFAPLGPFWSHPVGQTHPDLPARKIGIDYAALGLAEFRIVEQQTRGAKSPWMLYNPGSVGSQSLLGLPLIHRLREGGAQVWPFDEAVADVVLAEVYPSLLGPAVAALQAKTGEWRDQIQVRLLARALWNLNGRNALAALMGPLVADAQEEGWILGAGHAALLAEALTWP